MEGAFAPWHIVIIGVLVLVFFGGKRLPDSARSLGQALRIFKAETRGLRDDVPPVTEAAAAVPAAPVAAAVPAAPVAAAVPAAPVAAAVPAAPVAAAVPVVPPDGSVSRP
ncbi:MAG: hypothetical protein NVSMB55_12470 [Mycobacteriales bacterium]